MLASRCGFTIDLLSLKSVYFGGTTKAKAHFKATAELNPSQVALLLKREKIIA